MADPVAVVEKIVRLGLAIKDAVDTVRHNEEECREIRKRVFRFSAILTELQQTGMINDSPAMSGALEDLEETLQQALELVTACQERSSIRRFVTAGDLSKQLRRVKDDILNKVMLASFAIHATTIVLLTVQAGGRPLLRQTEDAGAVQSTNDVRSESNDLENNSGAGRKSSCAPALGAITEFRWSELMDATMGFSSPIGRGAFSCVYKGLLDGRLVAIKIPYKRVGSAWPHGNYDQLLAVVPKLQHKNVVKFVGVGHFHEGLSTYVMQLFKRKKGRGKEKGSIWVEEYVPNGSLADIIRESRLDWPSLFRIIEGVAQGLHYLHEQRVVHMDVKPDSILLDSDMNPVITDFNISFVLDDDDEKILDNIVGTRGYVDPDTLAEGIVSTKNDVYSFGITLLVAVNSIHRCSDSRRANSSSNHIYDRWAWKAWEAGRIEEEFDPSSFDGSQLTEIKRCVQVGLLCAQRDRADRPTMAHILEMLHGEKELPVPKIPSWISTPPDGSD